MLDNLLNRPPGVTLAQAIKAWLATETATWANKTLTAPVINDPRITGYIDDVDGAHILQLTPVAGATNYLQIANATSSSIVLKVQGTATNLNYNFQPKGAGVVRLTDGNGAIVAMTKAAVASSVNYVTFGAAAAGSGPSVNAEGADTNVPLNLAGKGGGPVQTSSPLAALSTIDLGHATDTTIARIAAGRIAVEGAAVITATEVAALTAKPTPVATDTIAVFDSAAGGAPKRVALSDLKGAGLPYDITYVQTVITRAVGLGSNQAGIRAMRAFQISSVAYRCVDADASGNLVVELRKNGVQIASSVATIAAASQVAGAVVNGVNASFAAGDILTVYITAVGTTPGTGLYVDIAAVTV